MSGMLDRLEPSHGREARSGEHGHVVFVVGEPFPQSIRVEKEIRTFQRMGFSVDVVAQRQGAEPRQESRAGVRITRVGTPGRLLAKMFRAIEKLIFVDIVFLLAIRRIVSRRAGPVLLFVRGLRLVRTAHWSRLLVGRVVLVYDIHDMYHLAKPSYRLETSLWERIFQSRERMLRLDRSCVRVANAVVVANPPYIDIIGEWGTDPAKLILLPNHEDLEWFDDLTEDPHLTERYRGRFVVSYIGSFGVNRELDVLMQAVPHLRDRIPNVELVLAGPLATGDLPHKEKLEELAEALGVSDCVDFVGRVPFERIADFVRLSDVCMMPLRDCAHSRAIRGHKLFHYMAGSRPILASDLPEQRRVLRQAECGLLYRPGDPRSLAECAARLYDDPGLRGRLGSNGRKAVERFFSWRTGAEDFVAAVRELSAEDGLQGG